MSFIESTHHETEQTNNERDSALGLIEYAEQEMRTAAPILLRLLQKRHELFEMNNTEFDPSLPIESQLYDDPFYNDTFYVKDLRVRTGADYHTGLKETFSPVTNATDEQGNPAPEKNDSAELLIAKKNFRQAIIEGAQVQGYVSRHPGTPLPGIDTQLGILPSELEPIDKPVGAVVILGAAGISNLIRVRDAVRNIESGAVKTNTIIFAAGERTAASHEATAFENLGCRPGVTEFEQGVNALEGIAHVQFEDELEKYPAHYGAEVPNTTVRRGTVVINDQVITVLVAEGCYDRNRKDMMSGQPANRSITSETMQAIIPFLQNNEQPILIESHDTWGKGQEIVAHEIFGVEANLNIIGTWAYKSDRLFTDEDANLDIKAPEAVIDEMSKAYFNLVRLKMAALNKLALLDSNDTPQ